MRRTRDSTPASVLPDPLGLPAGAAQQGVGSILELSASGFGWMKALTPPHGIRIEQVLRHEFLTEAMRRGESCEPSALVAGPAKVHCGNGIQGTLDQVRSRVEVGVADDPQPIAKFGIVPDGDPDGVLVAVSE